MQRPTILIVIQVLELTLKLVDIALEVRALSGPFLHVNSDQLSEIGQILGNLVDFNADLVLDVGSHSRHQLLLLLC